MHSLPVFLRLAGRPVILLGAGEGADAKRRLLERAGAIPAEEGADAQLAIVAIEDDAEALPAIARLRARGILINAVDRPALCDFTLPAIVDRDPVLIAIGTGGASAGLAKALRQRLEALLPGTLGALATRLFALRGEIRSRWPEPADRRRAIDAALSPGAPLDPFAAHDTPPAESGNWLLAPAEPAFAKQERIALRSRDPDDLTLREARLLGQADRIYHTADVPATILDRARADAARIAGVAPEGESPAPGLTIHLSFAPPGARSRPALPAGPA